MEAQDTVSKPISPADSEWLLPAETGVSIIAGCALSKNTFTIAISIDGAGHDEFEDFSRLFRWDSGTWIATDFVHRVDSIVPYKHPGWADIGYALLSQQGVITYLGNRPFQETMHSQTVSRKGFIECRN